MLETIVALTLAVASAAPIASLVSTQQAQSDTHVVALDIETSTLKPEDELQLHAPPHAYLMVEALRRGGLILFVRHGVTALDGEDEESVAIGDCGTQRSLSQAGRALAAEVGNAVRELKLPLGPVFTSAYCRCRETADLMFGNGLRVADLAVSDRNDADAGIRLLSVIARMPPPVGDTVLVGHLQRATQAYGVMPDEGETLVIAPAHDGQGPELIGHITATQWSDIARDYRRYGERITRMVETALASGAAVVAAPSGSK